MSFFSQFPRINYTTDKLTRTVTNICTAFLLKRIRVDDSFVFQRYIVQDGDTPEVVSEKLYSTPDYYWVILLVNSIVNPMTEWYMDSRMIEAFAEAKYADGAQGIHHFFDTTINRICDDVDDKKLRKLIGTQDFPAEIRPITNYQFEIDQNDERREIIVINPRAIGDFVEDFQTMIAGRSE